VAAGVRTALALAVAAALAVGIDLVSHAAGGQSRPAGGGAIASHTPRPGRTSTSDPVVPHPTGQQGDYHVGERPLNFVDHRGAAGERVLHVVVRYPVSDSSEAPGVSFGNPFPLIVFAPGYAQCDDSYGALLNEWASAGFVVAAVNFPRTNCHIVNPDESDLVNQPADMEFVINKLIQLARQPGNPITELIDATKVAVAGQSDGGDTVAALAAMSCCQDPALRATIVLAGAEWPAFGGTWFSTQTPPMLFVQGTADAINPPAASLQMYAADHTGPRFYLQLTGAGHLTPYTGVSAPEPVVARVTIAFLDHYLASDLIAISAIRRAGDVARVSRLVSGGRLP
jgi:predicted dienelactone hydrolase